MARPSGAQVASFSSLSGVEVSAWADRPGSTMYRSAVPFCPSQVEQKGRRVNAIGAYISHGVLSGGAVKRIAGSRLKELVITDSIQPTKEIQAAGNIRILEIASLIGEAIGRTAAEESVSSLFD